MQRERKEYIKVIESLGGDVEGRKTARRIMDASDAKCHGASLEFPYVPYLFNADDRAFLTRECTMAHRILVKVIERFCADPSYRPVFHFPKEVEDLILLPCSYSQMLPICRFDLFLDETDRSYKFCEFNADGSGAMSRDAEMARALSGTESFRRFSQAHDVRPFELFDSMVDAFIDIYRDGGGSAENPTIAVTDFAESGVFSDFDRFIAAFERAGYPARFVDTRALSFDGEHLIDPSDGTIIDAVYRRAVTSELIGHFDECRALIDAVAAEKVCLIGHFRTTVAHSKMVSVALFDPRTRAFLTAEECAYIDAHVPRTHRLRTDEEGFDLDEVLSCKNSWIIKPEDDYGAHGVYPGIDSESDEWERIVCERLDQGYVLQEYYEPHEVPIINTRIDETDPCKVESWQSMPGVYLYNGKPVGLYCRLGKEGVIALDHNGLCAPSFQVD